MVGHLLNNPNYYIKKRLAAKYNARFDRINEFNYFFEFRKTGGSINRYFNKEDRGDIFFSEERSSLLAAEYSIDGLRKKALFLDHEFENVGSLVLERYIKYLSSNTSDRKGKVPFLVMGIINVTPDSFSDGGKYFESDKAVDHALKLLKEGADIIDIGGESSRPGAVPVSEKSELERVIPVIEKIKGKNQSAKISIDTTKSNVARKAVEAGAEIINDISGGIFDPEMISVAAAKKVPLVIMHIKGEPETMQKSPFYEDVVSEIYDYFWERIETVNNAGLRNLIIDPGIGFGKRVKDNFEILNRLDEFRGLGFPILAGLSRKSFIGKSLNLDVEKRDNATLCAEVYAAMNGADIIRTHNVKNAVEAKQIISLIENPEAAENV